MASAQENVSMSLPQAAVTKQALFAQLGLTENGDWLTYYDSVLKKPFFYNKTKTAWTTEALCEISGNIEIRYSCSIPSSLKKQIDSLPLELKNELPTDNADVDDIQTKIETNLFKPTVPPTDEAKEARNKIWKEGFWNNFNLTTSPITFKTTAESAIKQLFTQLTSPAMESLRRTNQELADEYQWFVQHIVALFDMKHDHGETGYFGLDVPEFNKFNGEKLARPLAFHDYAIVRNVLLQSWYDRIKDTTTAGINVDTYLQAVDLLFSFGGSSAEALLFGVIKVVFANKIKRYYLQTKLEKQLQNILISGTAAAQGQAVEEGDDNDPHAFHANERNNFYKLAAGKKALGQSVDFKQTSRLWVVDALTGKFTDLVPSGNEDYLQVISEVLSDSAVKPTNHFVNHAVEESEAPRTIYYRMTPDEVLATTLGPLIAQDGGYTTNVCMQLINKAYADARTAQRVKNKDRTNELKDEAGIEEFSQQYDEEENKVRDLVPIEYYNEPTGKESNPNLKYATRSQVQNKVHELHKELSNLLGNKPIGKQKDLLKFTRSQNLSKETAKVHNLMMHITGYYLAKLQGDLVQVAAQSLPRFVLKVVGENEEDAKIADMKLVVDNQIYATANVLSTGNGIYTAPLFELLKIPYEPIVVACGGELKNDITSQIVSNDQICVAQGVYNNVAIFHTTAAGISKYTRDDIVLEQAESRAAVPPEQEIAITTKFQLENYYNELSAVPEAERINDERFTELKIDGEINDAVLDYINNYLFFQASKIEDGNDKTELEKKIKELGETWKLVMLEINRLYNNLEEDGYVYTNKEKLTLEQFINKFINFKLKKIHTVGPIVQEEAEGSESEGSESEGDETLVNTITNVLGQKNIDISGVSVYFEKILEVINKNLSDLCEKVGKSTVNLDRLIIVKSSVENLDEMITTMENKQEEIVTNTRTIIAEMLRFFLRKSQLYQQKREVIVEDLIAANNQALTSYLTTKGNNAQIMREFKIAAEYAQTEAGYPNEAVETEIETIRARRKVEMAEKIAQEERAQGVQPVKENEFDKATEELDAVDEMKIKPLTTAMSSAFDKFKTQNAEIMADFTASFESDYINNKIIASFSSGTEEETVELDLTVSDDRVVSTDNDIAAINITRLMENNEYTTKFRVMRSIANKVYADSKVISERVDYDIVSKPTRLRAQVAIVIDAVLNYAERQMVVDEGVSFLHLWLQDLLKDKSLYPDTSRRTAINAFKASMNNLLGDVICRRELTKFIFKRNYNKLLSDINSASADTEICSGLTVEIKKLQLLKDVEKFATGVGTVAQNKLVEKIQRLGKSTKNSSLVDIPTNSNDLYTIVERFSKPGMDVFGKPFQSKAKKWPGLNKVDDLYENINDFIYKIGNYDNDYNRLRLVDNNYAKALNELMNSIVLIKKQATDLAGQEEINVLQRADLQRIVLLCEKMRELIYLANPHLQFHLVQSLELAEEPIFKHAMIMDEVYTGPPLEGMVLNQTPGKFSVLGQPGATQASQTTPLTGASQTTPLTGASRTTPLTQASQTTPLTGARKGRTESVEANVSENNMSLQNPPLRRRESGKIPIGEILGSGMSYAHGTARSVIGANETLAGRQVWSPPHQIRPLEEGVRDAITAQRAKKAETRVTSTTTETIELEALSEYKIPEVFKNILYETTAPPVMTPEQKIIQKQQQQEEKRKEKELKTQKQQLAKNQKKIADAQRKFLLQQQAADKKKENERIATFDKLLKDYKTQYGKLANREANPMSEEDLQYNKAAQELAILHLTKNTLKAKVNNASVEITNDEIAKIYNAHVPTSDDREMFVNGLMSIQSNNNALKIKTNAAKVGILEAINEFNASIQKLIQGPVSAAMVVNVGEQPPPQEGERDNNGRGSPSKRQRPENTLEQGKRKSPRKTSTANVHTHAFANAVQLASGLQLNQSANAVQLASGLQLNQSAKAEVTSRPAESPTTAGLGALAISVAESVIGSPTAPAEELEEGEIGQAPLQAPLQAQAQAEAEAEGDLLQAQRIPEPLNGNEIDIDQRARTRKSRAPNPRKGTRKLKRTSTT